MLMQVALLAQLLAVGAPPVGTVAADRPKIEVWTNRGDDPYTSGEVARAFFKTDQDAYVTLLRVDTDGRVHMLFPREPWGDNFVRGGHVYEIDGAGSPSAFRIDDYPGEGYLFGVAAYDPFTYDAVASAQHWDYRLIGDDGQIRGDPYAALTDLASRMVPDGYGDWDYDIVPYYVQQHYQYPRFLCYDCHSAVSYVRWNPYDYSCVRFRMVVYDDPYYYPYRYYGGTRVVFTRPYRAEPRFIFKDRNVGDPFVTRVRERPMNDNRRRDVGVRGQDIGRPGAVPPPTWGAPRDQRGGTGADARRVWPDRPDRPAQPERPDVRRPEQPERQAPPVREDRPPSYGRPPSQDHSGRSAKPRPAAPPPRQAPSAAPHREGSRGPDKGNQPQLRRRRP